MLNTDAYEREAAQQSFIQEALPFLTESVPVWLPSRFEQWFL